jgi:hypothetical protein
MTSPLTIECTIHFHRHGKGAAKDLRPGTAPTRPASSAGRLPRVTRLLALAHRFDALLRSGQVADYGELARLGRVSRARVSQILLLLELAPDIQEALLFLDPVVQGRAPWILADVLPIARVPDWAKQRRMWKALGRAAAYRTRVAPDGKDADGR